MVSSKNIIEKNSVDGVVKRVFQANQIIKNPEFLKIINEIAAKSKDQRTSFASSELAIETLKRRGVALQKGTTISFRVPPEGKSGIKRKVVAVSVSIPNVGVITIRSPAVERPTKDQSSKD